MQIELAAQAAATERDKQARALAGAVDMPCQQFLAGASLTFDQQWQGLRGEDLDIDLGEERSLTCSRTKMRVTFTPDRTKYFNQVAEVEA